MPKVNTPLLNKVIECRKDFLSKNQPLLKKGVYIVKTIKHPKLENLNTKDQRRRFSQKVTDNMTSRPDTADTVRLTTADLIFGDLYSDKLRLQKEIINLRSLLNTKVELIITNCTHHSIFIFKEEIETLLKNKLEKAQKKFEYYNLKIMQIKLNTGDIKKNV